MRSAAQGLVSLRRLTPLTHFSLGILESSTGEMFIPIATVLSKSGAVTLGAHAQMMGYFCMVSQCRLNGRSRKSSPGNGPLFDAALGKLYLISPLYHYVPVNKPISA